MKSNNFLPSLVKGTETHTIYRKTEEFCHRFSAIIIQMMINLTHVVWGIFLVNSIYQMLFKSNFDTSTWIAPFNIAVPYLDTTTLWGWSLFYVVQGFLAYSYSLNQSIIIAFFLSCCLYTEALCEHFALAIRATECRELDASGFYSPNESFRRMETQKNLMVREKFIAAIQLHSKLME